GVVALEHHRLVRPHVRKIEPTMTGVKGQRIDLARAVRVQEVRRNQVPRTDASRIAHGERGGLDRSADRLPDVDDREALAEQRFRLRAGEIANALRSRSLRVIVVSKPYGLLGKTLGGLRLRRSAHVVV